MKAVCTRTHEWFEKGREYYAERDGQFVIFHTKYYEAPDIKLPIGQVDYKPFMQFYNPGVVAPSN